MTWLWLAGRHLSVQGIWTGDRTQWGQSSGRRPSYRQAPSPVSLPSCSPGGGPTSPRPPRPAWWRRSGRSRPGPPRYHCATPLPGWRWGRGDRRRWWRLEECWESVGVSVTTGLASQHTIGIESNESFSFISKILSILIKSMTTIPINTLFLPPVSPSSKLSWSCCMAQSSVSGVVSPSKLFCYFQAPLSPLLSPLLTLLFFEIVFPSQCTGFQTRCLQGKMMSFDWTGQTWHKTRHDRIIFLLPICHIKVSREMVAVDNFQLKCMNVFPLNQQKL